MTDIAFHYVVCCCWLKSRVVGGLHEQVVIHSGCIVRDTFMLAWVGKG